MRPRLLVRLAGGALTLLAASMVPSQADEYWADFTQPVIATSNMTVWVETGFQWNEFYSVWQIRMSNGAFTVFFDMPAAGTYVLRVVHLSSSYAGCQFGGYAPMNVFVNGDRVVQDYDPAEHHAADHGWMTDAWPIAVQAGQNTLRWVAGPLCTHYWIQRLELLPYTPVDTDLEAREVAMAPEDLLPGEAPGALSIRLANISIEPLAPPNSHVEAEFRLSRTGAWDPAEDLLLGRCGLDLAIDAYGETNLSLPPGALAMLRVPGCATGGYYLTTRIGPASPSVLGDSWWGNNIIAATNPVHVTPLGKGVYADLSWPEVATNRMSVTLADCAFYHEAYRTRLFFCEYAPIFSAAFDVPSGGHWLLSLRHATAGNPDCPDGGRTPISIYVNDFLIGEDFDPAENHAGLHGFVTDSWSIPTQAGTNELRVVSHEVCPAYALRRVEITPLPTQWELSRPVRLRSGACELVVRGEPGRRWTLEATPDFQAWGPVTNALNATGTVVLRDDGAKGQAQRFYRVVAE